MAASKAKRSVHPSKAARRNDRRASTRHLERSKPAERKSRVRSTSSRRTQPKSNRKKSSRKRRSSISKPSPGELALQERTLPFRRFVSFPLVKGKVAEKVELFTSTNNHSLAIEFQDHSSLHLNIEPGFTIQAELMQMEKGNLETLAEWPPIQSKGLNDSN